MEWLYAKGIPIEAQYLYRKAREMAGRGRDDAALNYYRQALIIAPTYAQAMFEMGNCYAHRGEFAEALLLYERAIGINPESVEMKQARERISSVNGKRRS